MSNCLICGAALERVTVEEVEEVDGVRIAHQAEALRCPHHAEETRFEPAAMLAMEATRASALVRAGIPGGRSFQWVRTHLGFTGREFAALLDVAAETLSRWETGEREIPRAARALLVLLFLERDSKHAAAQTVLAALRDHRPVAVADAA